MLLQFDKFFEVSWAYKILIPSQPVSCSGMLALTQPADASERQKVSMH